jgi:hypothetical protein
MSNIPVNLAVEDDLSEAVLRRLLTVADRGYAIGAAFGKRGFGYLRKTISGWNQAARGVPWIVLADLDNQECPASLVNEWLPIPKHHNLLFRVAFREVEAWLLADIGGLAGFLGCKPTAIPVEVESLPDPKAVVVGMARKSRFVQIRRRIAPKAASTGSPLAELEKDHGTAA